MRNPYERTVSDLFFWNLIDEKARPEHVTIILKKYLICDYETISNKIGDYQPPEHCIQKMYDYFDNHIIPQWMLCAKNANELHSEIVYMKTETLSQDMRKFGFADFDAHELSNHLGIKNYYDYLNDESIELINSHFGPDFDLFGYERIIPKLKE